MITAKFGGTAVTPNNLVYLKKIVGKFHRCVVVSAIGKSQPKDVKTTDLLKEYFVDKNPATWQIVCDRYKKLALQNCINADVEKLLFDAKVRALNFGLDYCMSLGEELSAKLVATFLDATYVEAEDTIFFAKTSVNPNITYKAIQNAFSGVKLGVIGGFYGKQTNTRKTFSRGGSDVTASICASALCCSLCENWTDANGVCQANPTEVLGAQTLTHLSYAQMNFLAKNGATVLHHDAVKPLQKFAIPLKIANFYNVNAPSTLITNAPNNQKLLCVTQKSRGEKFVITVLHNMSQLQVANCLQKFYGQLQPTHSQNALCEQLVQMVNISPNVTQFLSTQNLLPQVYLAFCNTLD